MHTSACSCHKITTQPDEKVNFGSLCLHGILLKTANVNNSGNVGYDAYPIACPHSYGHCMATGRFCNSITFSSGCVELQNREELNLSVLS